MSRIHVRPSPADPGEAEDVYHQARELWVRDLVDGAKAVVGHVRKEQAKSEAKLLASFGSLLEAEAAKREARAETWTREAVAAFREEAAELRLELRQLRERVDDLSARLDGQERAAQEASRAVKEDSRQEVGSLLAGLQQFLQDLYANAPQPQILLPPEAIAVRVQIDQTPSVVNIPPEAIKLTLPPVTRTKSILYDDAGRPRTITEEEKPVNP